jgi:hypothetical protein
MQSRHPANPGHPVLRLQLQLRLQLPLPSRLETSRQS